MSVVHLTCVNHFGSPKWLCWLVIGIDTSMFGQSGVTRDPQLGNRTTPLGESEGCGGSSRGWRHTDRKSRYQVLFYHGTTNLTKFMQVRVCTNTELLRKLLWIKHYGKHGGRSLLQQPPQLRHGNHCDITVMAVSLRPDNMPQWKTVKTRYLCRI